MDTDRVGSDDTSGSGVTETDTPGSEVALTVRPGRAATASLSEVAGMREVTSNCGAGVTVSSGIRAGSVTEVSGSAGGRAGTPGRRAAASGKPGSNANSGSPGTRGSSPSDAGTPVDRAEHGLINYIDTKAKCRHLKKLTFTAGVYPCEAPFPLMATYPPLYTCILYIYSHRERGGGDEPERRLEGQ